MFNVIKNYSINLDYFKNQFEMNEWYKFQKGSENVSSNAF